MSLVLKRPRREGLTTWTGCWANRKEVQRERAAWTNGLCVCQRSTKKTASTNMDSSQHSARSVFRRLFRVLSFLFLFFLSVFSVLLLNKLLSCLLVEEAEKHSSCRGVPLAVLSQTVSGINKLILPLFSCLFSSAGSANRLHCVTT